MVQIFLFFRLTWKFLDLSRPTVGEIRLRKDGELFSARKKLCKTKLIVPIVLRFYLYIESENIGDRVGLVPSKSFDVRESILLICLYDVTFLYFLNPIHKRSSIES